MAKSTYKHAIEEEGARAYDNGYRFVENPYPQESEDHQHWNRGWSSQHQFDLEKTYGAKFG